MRALVISASPGVAENVGRALGGVTFGTVRLTCTVGAGGGDVDFVGCGSRSTSRARAAIGTPADSWATSATHTVVRWIDRRVTRGRGTRQKQGLRTLVLLNATRTERAADAVDASPPQSGGIGTALVGSINVIV